MFILGGHSLRELEGVHPKLVSVVREALLITPIDFTVHDGIRTEEEQRRYVNTGVSQTMDSRHLVQPSGFGEAVDLVPYINRKLRWEIIPCVKIAQAVAVAAEAQKVSVRWGGCWRIITGATDTQVMMEAYISRKRLQGRRPFVDGPHFELC